jgi:hypothetical protein
MKRLLQLSVGLLAALITHAGAASFSAQGTLAYHNDVAFIPLALDQDAVDIRFWTDSFQAGANIDPIVALWHDGALVAENDDYPWLGPGQTWYDSGIFLSRLAAGDYLLSVAKYANFAYGYTLADGFNFDAHTPTAISNGHWQLHMLTDSPLPPVPEPAPAPMLLAGALLLTLLARNKHIRRPLHSSGEN